MVPPSLEFYALTFALFKAGAVVVLIDPGMGVKNLGVCLKEAEPEARSSACLKLHLARVLLGWGAAAAYAGASRSVTASGGKASHSIKCGDRLVSTSPYQMAETNADDTAAILFTSGSTGVAKGVVATHGIFANQVEMLRRSLYHIEPGEIDLPTFSTLLDCSSAPGGSASRRSCHKWTRRDRPTSTRCVSCRRSTISV